MSRLLKAGILALVMALAAAVPVLADAGGASPFNHTSAVDDQYSTSTTTGLSGTVTVTVAASTTSGGATSSVSGTQTGGSPTSTTATGTGSGNPNGNGLGNNNSGNAGSPVLVRPGVGAVGGLPFTGLNLLTIILIAAVLLAIGAVIRVLLRVERRLRSDPAR